MKRKNNRLINQWHQFRYTLSQVVMKVLIVAWVTGMSGFAIFVLLTILSVE